MASTRSVTLRIPTELYDTLNDEATTTGTSVTKVIVTRLSGPQDPPDAAMVPAVVPLKPGGGGIAQMAERAPQVTGEVGAHRRSGGAQADVGPRQGPSSSSGSTLDPADERNRRHLSPVAAPDRTKVRTGYTVAESVCEHPRASRQQFSYMTRCGLCGRRLL